MICPNCKESLLCRCSSCRENNEKLIKSSKIPKFYYDQFDEENAICNKCKYKFSPSESLSIEWDMMIQNKMRTEYTKLFFFKYNFDESHKSTPSSIIRECFFNHFGFRIEEVTKEKIRLEKIKYIINE